MPNAHKPIMIGEALDYLSPQKGGRYLDLTAGLGGHAKKIAQKMGDGAHIVLVDRDEEAAANLADTFSGDKRINIINNDYCAAAEELLGQSQKFDCILADLGLSSAQLDQPERGFSFQEDGPLDMRFDKNQALDGETVVNRYSRRQLAQLLVDYGELTNNQAYKLADRIIRNRPIKRTSQLAQAIKKGLNTKQVRDVQARVFQAIRIEVNRELELLSKSLPIWTKLLARGGRLAVITFHSLEDAAVKRFFAENSRHKYDSQLEVLTAKPITPSNQEIVYNPRSRSAKLRVASRK